MSAATSDTWPDYRAVWRWHFYAGIFCIPFVIVLSITGAIYLFKPQVEAWMDQDFDNLAIEGPLEPISAQVQAALTAFPESTPSSYELPPVENGAGRVLVRTKDGEQFRVYIHPQTLKVLHSIPDADRLMRWMFRLHGELLMGNRGSNIVELASSWAVIMLVTGAYLWWPRHSKGLGGVLYPRLRMGSGILWRDLHSVTGIWITAFALFLLATGLPWAKFWGSYFKEIRRLTGTAVAQQDWTVGAEPRKGTDSGGDARRSEAGSQSKSSGGEHGDHGGGQHRGGGSGRGRRGPGVMPKDMTGFDRVAATIKPLGLEYPVSISPPSKADSDEWTAKSNTGNRPLRVNLVVNGKSGEITSREDFKDRHVVDRVVGYGIAAHEGQLFGWFNQLLGLLTAIGLVLVSVSGVVMWWRRRDVGVLGAPKVLVNPRVSWGLIALIVLFGIYLPLFGASLLLVLVVEVAVLKRIPKVRDWLGLNAPATTVGAPANPQ